SRGFAKDGNKNRLRERDIHRLVDTFERGLDVPRYARMVPLAEIEANDCNLNIPRYIDATEPEGLQDIDPHTRGGIPERDGEALAPYGEAFPTMRNALFEPAGRPVYLHCTAPPARLRELILEHPEWRGFAAWMGELFARWRDAAEPRLRATAPG